VSTLASSGASAGVDIAADNSFHLLADSTAHIVRRIDRATGTVTAIGSGAAAFADGSRTLASFNQPTGVAVAPNGLFALVCDFGNRRVRHIDIGSFAVTTLCGTGASGTADGAAGQATFVNPSEVVISFDSSFALVCDRGAHNVRKIALPSGAVTLLAGSGTAGFVDQTGASAAFDSPYSIALSADASYALVGDTCVAQSFFRSRITLAFHSKEHVSMHVFVMR
jgi:DNA-binding beta-propeller fold protein YncE